MVMSKIAVVWEIYPSGKSLSRSQRYGSYQTGIMPKEVVDRNSSSKIQVSNDTLLSFWPQ